MGSGITRGALEWGPCLGILAGPRSHNAHSLSIPPHHLAYPWHSFFLERGVCWLWCRAEMDLDIDSQSISSEVFDLDDRME
eukprot:5333587-Pyramimonas_sp.AAC.1